MANLNFVSSYTAIGKVFRDFAINNTGWEADGIEWIHEALQEIGTTKGTAAYNATLPIVNSRIKLPCNIENIDDVVIDDKLVLWQNYSVRGISHAKQYASGTILAYVLPPYVEFLGTDATEAKLFYRSFPVDLEGYPMINNSTLVLEAIAWYIVYKLCLRGLSHQTVKYDDAFTMWRKYRDLATNELLFPTPEENDLIFKQFITT